MNSKEDLHNQPYHRYLASLGPSYAGLLAWPGPAMVPAPLESNPTARSTIWVLEVGQNCQLSTRKFVLEPYDCHAVMQLQDHLRRTDEIEARVICVQTVLPAVIEALGATLNLQPKLFLQHLGNSWVSVNHLRRQRRLGPVFEREMDHPVSIFPIIDDDDAITLSIDFPRYVRHEGDITLQSRRNFPPDELRLTIEDAMVQGLHSNPIRWPSPEEHAIRMAGKRAGLGAPQTNMRSVQGSADTIHHFTLYQSRRDQVETSIIFFPPCYEGRFAAFGDATLHTTPMRPRGPETSYRQFSITQTATSHVETHTQLRDQADIEVFVKELTRSIEGEDHYHPGLPWLLAYHFSLGQWQDLTKRLQARHIYFIDSPAGKNANQWYSQALKRWTLKCLDSVGDVVCGLEVAQVVFGRDSAASTTTSSCHWRGGQASSRPYGSHVDFETMAIRHRQIERSLQNLLTRVDELIRQTESDLQAEVARVNIQHGKESIREAKSVRSLTTLAFIWIPISAVSAAFGTNTRELSGDRMPPLWVYILVATVVTGMTLLAAWIHRRHGDRVWKRLRTSHRDLKLDVMLRYRRFRHRLARRTPHPTG